MTTRGKHEHPAGTVLGGYRIERMLGRGGMGEVYEATHVLLDKRVALKVLAPHVASDGGAVQRFLREGKAASRVRHDHVIEIFDVGVDNGTVYMAMELLVGESLSDRFARGPVSSQELAALMLPVIAAVASAHDHGIIHRDLKPDNVFLRRDTRGEIQPTVLDFGISKLLDDNALHLTDTDAIMGTPYYMSPEQARGSRDVNAAADQYAIGVMLYEGATGRRPYEGTSLLEVVHKINAADYLPPRSIVASIPEPMERLLLQAMAVQPSQRHATLWALGLKLLPLSSATERARWTSTFERALVESSDTVLASHSDADAIINTTLRGAATTRSATRRGTGSIVWIGGAVAVVGVALTLTRPWSEPEPTRPPRTFETPPKVIAHPTDAPKPDATIAHRAESLLLAGKAAEAVPEFHRALKLQPNDANLFSGLAEAYRLEGLHTEARQQAERALALDASNVRAQVTLALLAAGALPKVTSVAEPIVAPRRERRQVIKLAHQQPHDTVTPTVIAPEPVMPTKVIPSSGARPSRDEF